MRPYGEQPKNSSAKRHPANECGVCAAKGTPKPTRARIEARNEIIQELGHAQMTHSEDRDYDFRSLIAHTKMVQVGPIYYTVSPSELASMSGTVVDSDVKAWGWDGCTWMHCWLYFIDDCFGDDFIAWATEDQIMLPKIEPKEAT